ncbi:MAG: histidinol dehydrogenase [Rickettsiales bacterium]|nr:histidinol dehydrogenase [Rickettsiales bacterium]
MVTKLQDTDLAGLDAALARRNTQSEEVATVVREILVAVKARGDKALIEYTNRFDDVALTPETLKFSAQEIAQAERKLAPELRAALERAAHRIRRYHEKQRPEDQRYTDESGVTLGWQYKPLTSVGLYVPGGKASYPSSVLMNAVPAKVAGVDRIVMVVPTPKGEVNPAVLVAASIAGVNEIYRVGGAQAIGALAYGTATIAAVDKIVGPGNAYVADAKRQVFGTVGIDTIAGPSEILVVADAKNEPGWIAADLLSQAEHDEAAQAILITNDARFAAAVEREIDLLLPLLHKKEIAAASWQKHGIILTVNHWSEALSLIERIAPEHLELAIDEPEKLAAKVRAAGAIFLGRHTPEAIGDYIAGPSHVLPTSRAARFSSGLSIFDFLTRTSIIGCTPEAARELAPAAALLADAEGLPAHALSLRLRTK